MIQNQTSRYCHRKIITVLVVLLSISTIPVFAQHPTFYPAVDSLAIWGTCIPPSLSCHIQSDSSHIDRIVVHASDGGFICGVPPYAIIARYDSAYFEIHDSLIQNRYEIWFTYHSPYDSQYCLISFDSLMYIKNGKFDITLFVIRDSTVVDSLVVQLTSYHTGLGVNDDAGTLPASPELYQNYPNPFNPMTRINYLLPTRAYVTLRIFNVAGQEVATTVNEYQHAGAKTAVFDAGGLPSGVYFYRLTVGSFTASKKMIIMR
jgi:hypothetical protein